LLSKPILRIIETKLKGKDVGVLRLREGYEFFKSNGATPQRSRGGDVHGTSSRGVIGFISVKGNQKV